MTSTTWRTLLLIAMVALLAHAGDGVIEINEAKALAGGVTAGDTEGYPVTISEPGSYRLTGNLTVSDENTNGIVITADNVTIDLNGFAITGPAECTGSPVMSCSPTGSGVGVLASEFDSFGLSNGVISGMGDNGIRASGAHGRIEDIQVHDNGGVGIRLGGGGQIIRCQARRNGASGIEVSGVVVSESVATGNSGVGIGLTVGTVTNSVTWGNGGSGIFAQEPAVVSGNVCTLNGGWGLQIGGTRVGYLNNSFGFNTGGDVTGGTSLGNNVCGGALCP